MINYAPFFAFYYRGVLVKKEESVKVSKQRKVSLNQQKATIRQRKNTPAINNADT
jgi:hypothetical protein